MGAVICLDPAFSSNCDINSGKPVLANVEEAIQISAQKRRSFRESVEVLDINQKKSPSSERSSVSSTYALDIPMIADWRYSDVGSCFSTSRTDSYRSSLMTKMTKVDWVDANLWIGSESNANNEDLLTRKGITHVLSLVGHQSSVRKVVRKQKVMDDKGRTNIKSVLDEVYGFMESGQKGNNKLLVHCKLGQNRSAVVIIAFLMKKFKMNLYRAHRELKKARPIVSVNVDYAKQLLDLELEYFGTNTIPSGWMEIEYNEATNELEIQYENMSTERQKSLIAKIDK